MKAIVKRRLRFFGFEIEEARACWVVFSPPPFPRLLIPSREDSLKSLDSFQDQRAL